MRKVLGILFLLGILLAGQVAAPAESWAVVPRPTSRVRRVKPVHKKPAPAPARSTRLRKQERPQLRPVKKEAILSSLTSTDREALTSSANRTELPESNTFRQAISSLYQQERLKTVFPGRHRIDAVIFDMDGTLLDSLPAWENAAAKLLRERGFEMTPEMEEYIKYISLTEGATYLKEQFNLPETPQELVALVLAHVREQYLTQIPAKPGVKELLQWLHEQDIKISVATASDKELAQRAFERLGLAQYIDFIITCDEVGVGKLSADIYEAARERMGTDKTRTLVVEDALYALKTAKNAGFLTVGVAEPLHSVLEEAQLQCTADYFFTSLEGSFR